MNRAVKGIIAIVILLALFYREPLVASEGEVRRGFSRIIGAPFALVRTIFGGDGSARETDTLRSENERLHAELAELRNEPRPATVAGRPSLEAKVYSRYPFSHQQLLTVRAGSRDGVTAGMAVVTADHVLVGEVAEAGERVSEVLTLFDRRFELAVKVGSRGTDALLVGDRVPRLTLIAREADVAKGESVMSAGRGFPLGTAIGSVGEVRKNLAASFSEADLAVPYAMQGLDTVYILR